jgi:hypothetical protein
MSDRWGSSHWSGPRCASVIDKWPSRNNPFPFRDGAEAFSRNSLVEACRGGLGHGESLRPNTALVQWVAAESRVLTAHGLHCKHILRNSGRGLVRSGCLDSSGIGEILGIMDNIHDYFDLYLAVPKGSVNDTGVRMLDSKHVDISPVIRNIQSKSSKSDLCL